MTKSQSMGDTEPTAKAKASSARADEILNITSKLVIDELVSAGISRKNAEAKALEIKDKTKTKAQAKGSVAGFSQGSKHTGELVTPLRAEALAMISKHTNKEGLIQTDGGLKKLGFWLKFTEPDTK